MHPSLSADWKLVDGTLRGLALSQAQLDWEIGQWLHAAARTKPWEKCGMRSFYEYFERIFGWAPQTISERLRTATELKKLPRLDAELSSGRLNFSAVRELTRVAKAETEQEWIDYARNKTSREIQEKVARHVKGERPKDPGDISRVKKRMTFALSADQFAIVSAALAMMREHDPTLTDGECLRMMAATAMNTMSASDVQSAASRPLRLQVEVGLDGTSFLKGIGEDRQEVSQAAVECAQCDAEIWIRRPDGTIQKIRTAIPQPMKRLLMEECKGRCEVCKIRIEPQGHHIWLVSEGGKHDLNNLIALCPAHHVRVHDGALWIEGTRATGFTFTMADGAPYGSGAPSTIAAHHIEVFQGLRHLGFKEIEIRPVLESLRDRELPIEELLRLSLREIHRRRSAPDTNAAASPSRENARPPAGAAQSPARENAKPATGATVDSQSDATEALRTLGFTDAEMRPVLLALRSRDLPLPELIRESLKMLHGRRNGSPARENEPVARPATASSAWKKDDQAKTNPNESSSTWEKAPPPNDASPANSPARETALPRHPVRKYKLRPSEEDGVAESAVPYGSPQRSNRCASPHAPAHHDPGTTWEIFIAC